MKRCPATPCIREHAPEPFVVFRLPSKFGADTDDGDGLIRPAVTYVFTGASHLVESLAKVYQKWRRVEIANILASNSRQPPGHVLVQAAAALITTVGSGKSW
jgi:hypothetical protein